ncbi:MAG: FkbM family methyltransferase [Actinomycetota bacterium]|nr:FkbM family methyltransferase [Actinomycetota bacterium]
MTPPEHVSVDPTPAVELPHTERIVSYAQNFEDVMLWRALRHVVAGTYIDVGAAWPDQDSVTLLFYQRGWSGVNVEPNPDLFSELRAQRPLDINIRAGVGAAAGHSKFNVLIDTGLSTFDNDLAASHAGDGRSMHVIETPITTLDQLWDEHLRDRQVHFLKVDVEGFEAEVLAGNTWTVHRPWIVVVEATRPNTQILIHEAWEPLLTDAGYSYVYGDGLNRYYVAHEHEELVEAFRFPPNVFDGFVSAAQATAEEQAREAQHLAWQLGLERDRSTWLQNEWDQAQHLLDQEREDRRRDHLALVAARIEADQARERADAAPAAALANHRWFHHFGNLKVRVRTRIRRMVRRPVVAILRPTAGRAARFVLRHPRVHALANRVLARIPQLRARLLALAHRSGIVAPASASATPPPAPEERSDTAARYSRRFRQPGSRPTEGAPD